MNLWFSLATCYLLGNGVASRQVAQYYHPLCKYLEVVLVVEADRVEAGQVVVGIVVPALVVAEKGLFIQRQQV